MRNEYCTICFPSCEICAYWSVPFRGSMPLMRLAAKVPSVTDFRSILPAAMTDDVAISIIEQKMNSFLIYD